MTEFLTNRRAFCFAVSGTSTSTASTAQSSLAATGGSDDDGMDQFESQMESEQTANTEKMMGVEQRQDEQHQMESAALKAFKEEDIS